MAEEQHELRRINWTEVFSFTHVFKSFRMAIHPSKLVLALAAVVLIFCLGWVMDRFWDQGDQYVYPNEIRDHATMASWSFDDKKRAWEDSRLDAAANLVRRAEQQKYSLNNYRFKLPAGHLQNAFAKETAELNKGIEAPSRSVEAIKKGNDYDDLLSEAEDLFGHETARIEKVLKAARVRARKDVAAIEAKDAKRKAKRRLEDDEKIAELKITELKVEFANAVRAIRGESIFESLSDWEQSCLANAVTAVRYGNIFGGLKEYRDNLRKKGIAPKAVQPAQAAVAGGPPADEDWGGFFYWVLMACHGLCWLVGEHWVYAVIFLAGCLAVIAFFGGAIHRIAALHFAREEKISIGQALRFSCGKFLSFFTAPLIPVAIILVLGAMLLVGGLFGSIPGVGTIGMGLLFFLAITLGLVIAFLTVGLLAGFPLMYPTIAVEGSDSFDAISRSFSYVFARPWRAGFYGLVALIYGVITYLFVRLFAFIALASAHYFVSWGVIGGGQRLHAEADKLDVMWQAPTFENLFGPFNWKAMTGVEPIGAWLIGVWVFLVAATVLAFLLSYAASSTTAIYYLLRRKVDATDLDDVYVEETEEEEQGPEEEPAEAQSEASDQQQPPAEQPPAEGETEAPGEEQGPGEGQQE